LEDTLKKDGQFEDPDGLGERKEELAEWEDVSATSRENANQDRDYYDGHQWKWDEYKELEARGQAPIVYNRIKPKIDFLLGNEIQTRKRPKAVPRTPDHEGDADGMTDMLCYVADETQFRGKFSLGAADVVIEGKGTLVVRTDITPPGPGAKILLDHIPWNRTFIDPRSRKPNGEDARYMGSITWMFEDDVRAMFSPYLSDDELDERISASISVGVVTEEGTETRFRFYNKKTKEFQVIEHYYRAFSERTGQVEWFECFWVGGGYLIEPREVPYRQDDNDDYEKCSTFCPMTVCSPYVTAGNSDTPERVGVVRTFISAQDEVNHRRSKAIHLLRSREIFYEDGALQEPSAVEAELLKSNPMIKLARNALKDKRVQIERHADLVDAEVQMLQEAKNEIDMTGPRPMPLSNEGGQKVSGRLYIAQQETGATEMLPVFDNLREWTIEIYKRYLWLIKVTKTEEDWFHVLDEESQDGFRLVAINQKMTRGERLQDALDHEQDLKHAVRTAFGSQGEKLLREATKHIQGQIKQMTMQAQMQGQQVPPPQAKQVEEYVTQLLLQHPLASEGTVKNDIARCTVDLIIDTSPNSVIAQHEQFTEMVGLAKDGMLPLANPKILVALFKASSLRNKNEIIKYLEAPPDEAQQQAQQMAQQAQQMQMAKQLELLSAQVADLTAKAQLNGAKAQLAVSQAQVEPTVGMKNQAQAQKAMAEARVVGPKAQAEVQSKQAQAQGAAFKMGVDSVPKGTTP